MSSLTPLEELEIKKGSTALTLYAKKAASARLQAKLDEFLADGGRIEQAVSAPFVPKFEITPEGKPKPKPKPIPPQTVRRNQTQTQQSEALRTKILNCNRSQAQASELLRTRIINCMHNHGRPMTPATVAEILRISRQKSSYHLSVMCKQGRVDLVSKLGSLAVYGVVK